MAYTNSQAGGLCENFVGNHGRGRMTCGRGRSSSSDTHTSQLCRKYGHVVVECWHMIDETFTPRCAHPNLTEFPGTSTDKHEASSSNSQAITMMAHEHDYYLLEELEKQTWFVDSCDSHHLIHYSYLFHIKKPYVGHNRVRVLPMVIPEQLIV